MSSTRKQKERSPQRTGKSAARRPRRLLLASLLRSGQHGQETAQQPQHGGAPLSALFGGLSFRCILADPPWAFADKGSRVCAEHDGCAHGYKYVSVDDIAALDVANVATPDALLFLWSTWSHLLDGSAHRVAKSWGFAPKTVIPWVKVSGGQSKAKYRNHPAVAPLFGAGFTVQIAMGHYTRGASEPLVLCVRKPGRIEPSRQLPGLIVAPRTSHSAKPEASYDFIETLCEGPRLELFARGPTREGWETWGDEAE